MALFEHVLVGLDLSERDPSTLKLARKLGSKFNVLHAVEGPHLPIQMLRKYPGLVSPAVDLARKQLDDVIAEHLKGAEVSGEVIKGSATQEMLVKAREADLVVVGRRPKGFRFAAVAKRLARKAPCSVLIVPEGSPERLNRILVGTDLSDPSAEALTTAIRLAKEVGAENVTCQYVYRIPPGGPMEPLTMDEFRKELKEAADQDLKEFLGKIDAQGVNVSPLLTLDPSPARAIEQAAETLGADLVVVGARGRSGPAAVLLGSTTEELIPMSTRPLLAVKRKGEGLKLLDILLQNP